ncbi:TetR-like C-terminal domain-containing protein [Micromonospora sp. CPCC 205556]|uniref:TetR-like C-terminal domain-containing protein n=1 Tax=Micromonospora sp. CPCC 205556 TaxID=3122398 RepID=UPI002FEFC590
MSSAAEGDAEPAGPAGVVAAARRLAEAEGWSAVTHRRLAERTGTEIELLYRRFPGPASLLSAVALRGFADLAAALATARAGAGGGAWPAVVTTYLDFAYANPQVYDAMLAHTSDLTLGRDPAPGAPRAAFAQLRAALVPLADGRDLDTLAEVGWSLLHGVVMLTRGGRLRPDRQEQREEMIALGLLAGPVPRRGDGRRRRNPDDPAGGAQ